MNDLYIHQLETENKQLRIALQECRKALEEEITTKKKAIECIKNRNTTKSKKERFMSGESTLEKLLEILGEKENE